MDRMPCCREYLSIDHPSKRDDLLKAFQGQSHRTGIGILSIFPPLEMSRRLKDFLRKDGCLLIIQTPSGGGIFIENQIVKRTTPSRAGIFFYTLFVSP